MDIANILNEASNNKTKVMDDILTTSFRSATLKEFARIISSTFPKSQITKFLEEVGCTNTDLSSWKLGRTLHSALVELQSNSGPPMIVKLIEIVCDPQEHIRKSGNNEWVVKKFNKCLKFSYMEINERNKLVSIHKEKKTSSTNKTNSNLFRSRYFHGEVVKHARTQFIDKHYFDAVAECCKAFEKHVAKKSKKNNHGVKLMSVALGDNGSLKLNQQRTETEKSLQRGLMYMCMGLMSGIRNPIEHEPQSDYSINRQDSLDVLSFISYLYRQIDQCDYVQLRS